MLAAAALALVPVAAAAGSTPAPLHGGGVCVGLAHVALRAGERATAHEGPDFTVHHFVPAGDGARAWSVYAGGFPSARAVGAPLLRAGGVVVRRAVAGQRFAGYLVTNGGWLKNHLFGAAFTGAAADRAALARLRFGAASRAICAQAEPR